jgi:hypothetical protein
MPYDPYHAGRGMASRYDPCSAIRSDRLSGVDLSAIAAFTAAGLSAINVVFSYRLTSRGHLEQWRREQERPIVARILTVSSDAYAAWREVAMAKQLWAESAGAPPSDAAEVRARYDAAVEMWKALRFEVAQLDLLAGARVRKVAEDLASEHERMRYRLNPSGAGVTMFRTGEEDKFVELHRQLVEQARTDLGLPFRGWQTPALRPW